MITTENTINQNKKTSVFSLLGIGYGVFGLIILLLSVFTILRVNFISSRLVQINDINSVK
ncbi:hypothetical protein [Helicobacter fennelliae]|nr:hypothetical protein [Helicobacter fennelliae]